MKEDKHRKYWQFVLAPLVPLVVIGGYFGPYLGYIAIGMLIFMLMLALFRGRYYCGWFCAMGSFHERVISRISCKKKMLPVFKAQWFRWTVFVLMMGLLTSRLVLAGGNPEKIGATFVMMWSIATGLAIGIGLIWKPRSWCSICPMGMIQGLIGSRVYRLKIGDGCLECGLCEKVCPIETNPGSMRSIGIIRSADCMRCGNCVVNCPVEALSFEGQRQAVCATVEAPDEK